MQEGDSIKYHNCTFKVLRLDGHYIKSIELTREPIKKPELEEESAT
ncbi:hypothetical protein [Gottfriedia acidiceleris]